MFHLLYKIDEMVLNVIGENPIFIPYNFRKQNTTIRVKAEPLAGSCDVKLYSFTTNLIFTIDKNTDPKH